MINVYCAPAGWLFEHLCQRFARRPEILRSALPVKSADVWICIRTMEAFRSPDPSRTLVQVHDLFPRDFTKFNGFGGVLFTHPSQQKLWKKNGYIGPSALQPIGARNEISVRSQLPEVPTVGCFTREVRRHGVCLKHSDLLIESAPEIQACFHVCSPNIIIPNGKHHRRPSLPEDYGKIDLLISLTQSKAIPLALYEACAAGVPVICLNNTEIIGGDWSGVIPIKSSELVKTANHVLLHREKWFQRRTELVRRPYLMDEWIGTNIALAQSLSTELISPGRRFC